MVPALILGALFVAVLLTLGMRKRNRSKDTSTWTGDISYGGPESNASSSTSTGGRSSSHGASGWWGGGDSDSSGSDGSGGGGD